jgi:predicted GH43/DUF377 family glycosyl hydrolase
MAVLKKKNSQRAVKIAKKKIVRVSGARTTKKTGNKKGQVLRVTVRKPAPKKKHQLLKRVHHNPVITPSHHEWESRATFNPAAVAYKDVVHLLYRAVGSDDRSVLGYAAMRKDGKIVDRQTKPAYSHFMRGSGHVALKIPYSSGGGTSGGCEDPRMTLIKDKLHLIYTAFDGWGSLRLTMTSISIDDFVHKRWQWNKPVMISPPGEIHKNWVLFPELINGKYALLHSISPEIQIAYFDSLDQLDGAHFVHSTYRSSAPRRGAWDSWVRGVGPPPIKTKEGWLVLYHAMDLRDPNRYKLGAMLLDLNDPTKVLYRAQQPVLEPDEEYENSGFKSGVIYSCGAIVKDGQLVVFYGGADTVACVAVAPLEAFVAQLQTTGAPALRITRRLTRW